MWRRFILVFAFFGALLGSPTGCGSSADDVDWLYTESEMEAAVVGTYTGTALLDGTEETLTLVISRAKARGRVSPTEHPQCGGRAFIKPALACAPRSSMTLVAELSSASGALAPMEFEGYFAAGRTLVGDLFLSAEQSALGASYGDGTFSDWVLDLGQDDRIDVAFARTDQ